MPAHILRVVRAGWRPASTARAGSNSTSARCRFSSKEAGDKILAEYDQTIKGLVARINERGKK